MNTEKKQEPQTTKGTRRTTSKQIVAMAGVICLVLLYLITLILAIADNSASGKWFVLSLCCTLVVPIIIFLYSWMWARLTNKPAPGDPETAIPPEDDSF